jgi:hypothetical protein
MPGGRYVAESQQHERGRPGRPACTVNSDLGLGRSLLAGICLYSISQLIVVPHRRLMVQRANIGHSW